MAVASGVWLLMTAPVLAVESRPDTAAWAETPLSEFDKPTAFSLVDEEARLLSRQSVGSELSLLPLEELGHTAGGQLSDQSGYSLAQPSESRDAETGLRRDWNQFFLAQAQTGQSGGAPMANPSPDEPINLEEIAKKLDNPLSDLWILFNQSDTSLWRGKPNTGSDAVINVTTIQPVLPVPLTSNWNLVTRPIIPLITAPTFRLPGSLKNRFPGGIGGGCPPNCLNRPPGAPPVQGLSLDTKRKFGIGDFNIWSMLSPSDPKKWGGLIWGIGPSFLFPTASIDQFGAGQYAMGPANILMKFHGKWTFGLFHQHLFGIGGSNDSAPYKVSQFQPIIFYALPKLWSIGMAPMATVDWRAGSGNELTFPLGLGISKTLLAFGKMPMRIGAEIHYSVVHPDGYGQRWNFRFYVVPVLPNPFAGRPLFGS